MGLHLPSWPPPKTRTHRDIYIYIPGPYIYIPGPTSGVELQSCGSCFRIGFTIPRHSPRNGQGWLTWGQWQQSYASPIGRVSQSIHENSIELRSNSIVLGLLGGSPPGSRQRVPCRHEPPNLGAQTCHRTSETTTKTAPAASSPARSRRPGRWPHSELGR